MTRPGAVFWAAVMVSTVIMLAAELLSNVMP